MNYPQFMVEDILAPRHSAHKFMTSTDPEYEQKKSPYIWKVMQFQITNLHFKLGEEPS